ncbi:methyltransferase domain protein [Collimonas arenae]|uniref:Methyltransferase domain protein n=1 Tax=Collimonas arenae TaxID=279058 RepID=A0A127QLW6_9BURK|nr:class I SAM-dependent methyltransferase [Collimonas arenae]AMP01156.1 methyltransferase domain protein [Collimonas arenae]AMP11050.1 methyltransferase domain protein [Collimonas arenae]
MLKILSSLFTLFKGKASAEPELAPLISKEGVVDSRVCGLIDAVQSGWFNHASGELAAGFKITGEDVVLDVGCGDGAATIFAARCGAEVIFSDSDAAKIARLETQVKNTPARAAQALVCDTDPLPLPDQRATRVIAMEMLEHVDDPAQVLAELVRVGRPGALYLLTVPDPVGEHVQQQLAPAAHFQKPNHIHIFERDAFAAMIANAGLIIESRQSSGFYWSMWMCLYWASVPKQGGATLDQIKAPYPPLLNEWANTWHQLIQTPGGDKVKEKLDGFMPKSQIIVARKPG